MKLWDEYALEQAKNVLSQSHTVTEAAEKLVEVLGRHVTKDSLRKAFGTYGLNPPSSYLQDSEDLDFEIDVEDEEERSEDDYKHSKSYVYIKETDTYYITLKSWRVPLEMPGDDVRSIRQAWSNFDGQQSTYGELQRKYGMRRQTVVDLLKAIECTHTSGPYTDEVLDKVDETTLVDDALRAKEERVLRKAEQRHWKRIQSLAEEAENFEKFVIQRIERSPLIVPPSRPMQLDLQAVQDVSEFSVMATPTDLHVGKKGWVDEVGQEYNLEITRERLMRRTETMVQDVLRYGRPKQWILGAGSDWFHIDNDLGLTTRGTPQDCDGTFARILQEGCRLAEDYVQALRAIAPVKVVLMAGNHDKISSLFLMHYLEAVYRNVDDVEVVVSPADRQYLQCGKTLVGITHGDGAKLTDLPLLMANEADALWADCPYRVWFTGHLHYNKTQEQVGTLVFQMPSLAGTDRWHYRNGYVGNLKSLNAYIIDHTFGVKGVLMSTEER